MPAGSTAVGALREQVTREPQYPTVGKDVQAADSSSLLDLSATRLLLDVHSDSDHDLSDEHCPSDSCSASFESDPAEEDVDDEIDVESW